MLFKIRAFKIFQLNIFLAHASMCIALEDSQLIIVKRKQSWVTCELM